MSEREINHNPMPEFHLFAPRINPLELAVHGIVRAVKSVGSFFSLHQLSPRSDHFPEVQGGASEMLDQSLDES